MYEIENDLSCHYGLTGNSQDATGALNTNHNATDFCVFFFPTLSLNVQSKFLLLTWALDLFGQLVKP